MMTTIFKTMLVTSLRDKITMFYSVIFPIALLIGLGYYFDNEDYSPRLVTGVIALSSLFWGVSGIAFQVHWQRSRGVYKLLKLTPYPTISFIFLMTAARTLLGIMINLLVLTAGVLMFDVTISIISLLGSIGIMFIGILCFTCLGFLISNFANNEGQINMISNLFFFPMIFGTDTFYSLEKAPEWVSTMGDLFPLGYYVKGLRAVLEISNESPLEMIIILVIYSVALLVLAAFTFKWESNGQLQVKKYKHRTVV
ncbi:ABC-2 type transport system permease protein [Ureibacillus xyleni]|uniref:Transport permease protein n=1 Tax=Ureibacillus xyleni TaxID=614648 RepID=A0A285SKF4_9BACL|nr:ABC transporter permease [Ureibacillus xyleni]SOC08397.1 ABC-2 type transport system permease protein [Ureibacillus xyleni]